MNKDKAIPDGYMTVGELAKQMGTTVRTLQYYDREGLLPPTSESDGGRRLYTHKDLIKLYQILSLKSLGFSLSDIKKYLISLDTPKDVAGALAEQAAVIRGKIESLTESLNAIEALKEEVLKMQSVDFKKYADIITNLQMKNDGYWMIKYLDDKTLDYVHHTFDKASGSEMIQKFTSLRDRAVAFHKNAVPPEDARAQKLAKEFWEMVTEFTGGDKEMLARLTQMRNFDDTDGERKEQQMIANAYMEAVLDVYFTRLGVDPFEGRCKRCR